MPSTGRGGRPRPPATRAAEDVGPYLGLSKTMAARNRPKTKNKMIAVGAAEDVGPYRLFDFPFVRGDKSR